MPRRNRKRKARGRGVGIGESTTFGTRQSPRLKENELQKGEHGERGQRTRNQAANAAAAQTGEAGDAPEDLIAGLPDTLSTEHQRVSLGAPASASQRQCSLTSKAPTKNGKFDGFPCFLCRSGAQGDMKLQKGLAVLVGTLKGDKELQKRYRSFVCAWMQRKTPAQRLNDHLKRMHYSSGLRKKKESQKRLKKYVSARLKSVAWNLGNSHSIPKKTQRTSSQAFSAKRTGRQITWAHLLIGKARNT
eukprot:gb/GECG01013406.1/.p1 GENE.gb/GECG01013406.1/~~gb/GECG01013406.1/.p1  ORF type:complete len:246 (+),score=28.80 gb/GECG01013406.1/:1-738(+)